MIYVPDRRKPQVQKQLEIMQRECDAYRGRWPKIFKNDEEVTVDDYKQWHGKGWIKIGALQKSRNRNG